MTFKLETEMAAPVKRWLLSQDYIVKDEFSLPWGICDLVAIKLDAKRIHRRQDLGQRTAIGPLFRIAVMMDIPSEDDGRVVRAETITKRYESIVGKSTITEQLDKLILHKFVKETRYGLQRISPWHPLHKCLLTIELKRYRVSEALVQARRHLQIATASYVGLPYELAQRVINSTRCEDFKNDGIGLLAISPCRCEEILTPRTQKHSQNGIQQTHVAERFWRTFKDS